MMHADRGLSDNSYQTLAQEEEEADEARKGVVRVWVPPLACSHYLPQYLINLSFPPQGA